MVGATILKMEAVLQMSYYYIIQSVKSQIFHGSFHDLSINIETNKQSF